VQNDLVLTCTGNGTHKRLEVGKFDWIPGMIWDNDTPREWKHMGLQAWRAGHRYVQSQGIESLDFPEGKFYRILCRLCRDTQRPPIVISDIELRNRWEAEASDTPGEVEVDVSA